MNQRIATACAALTLLAITSCSGSPWGSEAPTPPAAHARALSDGVAELTATEAQLAAAAANEPRRTATRPDGSNYFTSLAAVGRRGRVQAERLSHSTGERMKDSHLPNLPGLIATLNQLAHHYAALDGACQRADIVATREVRQAIVTAMVTLHSLTPHLGA
ncbi:hypothetical protein N8J89_16710 [Crossiella sp. CA-258035]|uniref:hypothetical protein n=1 Tax=Crossiella sp. CA-258035 TaxID=2981138 RepID=UPI0024BCFCA2|nr:hypothetical protein [Crossiella sp. CA-258035]WHT22640.1 hypothetical protein N8J89_16710 [Crossiella sp. CA-258035]